MPLGVIDSDAEATNSSMFIEFMRMSHSCLLFDQNTSSIYGLLSCLWREKSRKNRVKLLKLLLIVKCNAGSLALLRIGDFCQKPDWEIEAVAITITITIRLRFNHILNKLA